MLKRLKGRLNVPISVDTYKVEVAEKALEHGASIINDVSALTWEPDLVKPIVQYDAGLILNHMRGTPETWARLGPMKDVMSALLSELEAAIHRATRAGVGEKESSSIRVSVSASAASRIMRSWRVSLNYRSSRSLCSSPHRGSRSWAIQMTRRALEFATAAAVTTAILHGAAIVRVHDVAAMRPAVQAADAIMEATPEREEKPRAATKRSEESIEEKRRKPVRPTMKQPAPRVEKPAEEKPIDEPRAASEVIAPDEASPSEPETPRRPFERRAEAPPPSKEERPERAAKQAPEKKKFFEWRDDRPEKKSADRRARPAGPKEDRGRDDRAPRPPFRRSDAPAGDRPDRSRINVPVPQREIVRIVGRSSAAVLRHAAATIGIRSRTSAAALLLQARGAMTVLVTAVEIVGVAVAVETDHHAGLSSVRMMIAAAAVEIVLIAVHPRVGRPSLHEMENAVAAVRQLVGGPAEDALRVLAGTTAEIVQLAAPAATGHRTVDRRGAVALGHAVRQSDRAVVGPRADLGSELKISPLALGAVVGAPAGHHDFADRRPAIHTRLILAPIHAMPVLKRSASSFSVDVIRHG